jgi:hypothetical protein
MEKQTMSKLTKSQTKAHNEALALLAKPGALTIAERWEVYEKFNEAAATNNGEIGAHFTPPDLAMDMAIDMYNGGRVLDLCAGIGVLSFANAIRTAQNIDKWPEMVCSERNPAYCEIGRKLLPEATWICADVFDLPKLGLGRFDCAIGNPPFGQSAARSGKAPRYTGGHFDLHVIDLAGDFADYGCFLIPQMSSPFQFSGPRPAGYLKSGRGRDFEAQTGWELHPGCGVDTDYYRNHWKTTAVTCEIVTVEYSELRPAPAPEAITVPAIAATEPTPSGLQYTIPGCEKDRSRGPVQMDLF